MQSMRGKVSCPLDSGELDLDMASVTPYLSRISPRALFATPVQGRTCKRTTCTRPGAAWLLGAALLSTSLLTQAHAGGSLVLRVVDQETDEPMPARLVLRRSNGTSSPVRRAVDAGVGVAIDEPVELSLPPNTYHFEISRGPEYRVLSGSFTLERESSDSRTVSLPRIADMPAEGWMAGDILVQVPPWDLGVRMAAEALPVAGLLSGSADVPVLPTSAVYAVRTDLARGTGSAAGLLVLGASQEALDAAMGAGSTGMPLRSSDGSTGSGAAADRMEENSPSSDLFRAVRQARARGERSQDPKVIITNPLAWDVPIWLASERIDAVAVLGGFLQLDREITTIAGSRLPTKFDYGGPLGIGRWAEQVYWQILEAGLQLPPAAASGAGLVPNPVGYNRAYVHVESSAVMDPESLSAAWWEGLWEGRSVVTNGPLLRPTLDGFAPGHRFEATSGESLELTLELKLATADPVDYLEVVRDGRVEYHARLDEFARAGGRIPPLRFEQSGWVLVRVVTKYQSHFRAAISAPWFVTFDGQSRISSRGVEFFRTWLAEREQMLAELPIKERKRHAPYVRAARRFWHSRAEAANSP